MTAAILQGVMVTTFDTDIWVDLPPRQYIRLTNLLVKQGAIPMSPTVYVLEDGRTVNFLFHVNGIAGFNTEYRGSVTAKLEDQTVRVLPLEKILKSKKAIRRDKDLIHILLIERVLSNRKK
jgi:hypothetical protein